MQQYKSSTIDTNMYKIERRKKVGGRVNVEVNQSTVFTDPVQLNLTLKGLVS